MKTKHLLYILPLAALTACEPDIDELDFSNGTADFSKMVAVGNSLTAGYQSGALSADGQVNSLPAMIAGQMKQVGGGEFKQPLLTGKKGTDGVGIDPLLVPSNKVETRLALKGTIDCQGTVGLGPVRLGDSYDAPELFNGMANVAADGPYNNVAIPGAKLTDLDDPTFALRNPFYGRITVGGSLNDLAASLQASFFTMWIGNNDVLGYATAGGDDALFSPPLVPKPELTDAGIFDTEYNAAVASLTANGAKGVVANIPYVTSIPYFTTVKWNALVLTQAQADLFNSNPELVRYNATMDNPGLRPQMTEAEAQSRKISFSAGNNGFIFLDTRLTAVMVPNPDTTSPNPTITLPKLRQLKSGELLTLNIPGDDIRCNGFGSANLADPNNPVINPLTGNYVLDATEIQKIKDVTDAYNTTIKAAAQANGLAFVDANARLKELAATGIIADGISFSSTLVTGGAFSLDGVHPSTRGYAIIANDFISAINSTYSANVPKVSVGSFPTIEVEQ